MKVLCSLVGAFFLMASLATILAAAEPSTVFAPADVKTTPPDASLPQEIKAFFGETGKWWGTWYGTPPGHMEAILIIKRILDSKSAEVMYIVPNYPTWGVKSFTIERFAKFEKKDGRMYLTMPPSSNGQKMQFTFDAGAFIGVIEGPYLTANIVWETLK